MMGINWIDDYIKAGAKTTSSGELSWLASSEFAKIRMRVAENSMTPPAVLESLACDENPDVRLAVAGNPATPKRIIFGMVRDPDLSVRHGLAEDPNIPIDILRLLAEDDNPYVYLRARKTLRVLEGASASRFRCESSHWQSDLGQVCCA